MCSKSIWKLCKVLLKEYNGRVPGNIEQLIKLPGTGRKTANVVLGNIFNKSARSRIELISLEENSSKVRM